jgi:23S rRNA (adenine2503-C2)-methyltransferase
MGCPSEVTFVVQKADRPSIQSLLLEEIAAYLATWNERSYRAKQIADWLYQKRVASFDAMTDLPQALRAQLGAEFPLDRLETVRILGSKDATQKFLFRLSDGNLIESVLIPASPALYSERSDRRTICVSTQVGCAYGCKFCASGLDGWTRNLRAEEIVDQLLAVEKESGEKIDNVVFMGMGEPLANFGNLVRAIRIINAPWGLGIGARHITVSTSGLAPQIRQLAEESLQVHLAVSLHGATDAVRNQIMPVNRKFNLATLLDACADYVARKRKKIFFEYILIAGVNDTDEQAHELVRIAGRISAKINLIPYNTVEGLPWSRPPIERQERFLHILREAGVVATLRREKGHDIEAACGQLRLQTKRAELGPPVAKPFCAPAEAGPN